MLFSVFFLFFATSATIFAKVLTYFDPNKTCKLQLNNIVNYPNNNCAYVYLKKISKQLVLKTPLLFTSSTIVQSVLDSFTAKYGVFVTLINAMGYTSYSSFTDGYYPKPDPVFSLPRARAIAIGEGFQTNSTVFTVSGNTPVPAMDYKYRARNKNGEYYLVGLYILLADAPDFC